MKIERILKKIDLIKLLKVLKIQNIRDAGDNVMGLCPFHIEKNPSWGVRKTTGQYHCFSCGESGSLITLISKIKDISSKEAVQYLNKIAGIRSGNFLISGKTIYRQLKKMFIGNIQKQVIVEKEPIIELPLNLSDNYFGGIQYFEKRGIHQCTRKKHNISFCTSGFYHNRAIIPIYRADGSLLTFEARDIMGMADKKVLYPRGAKINRTLYNLQNAKQRNEVIIVEGLMDALYLSERGFNVVSTFGASISEQQEELLSRNFKKVYIAFDSDKAGLQGMIKYGHYLSLHLSVYIITLKKNTDPDNYSKKEFCRLYHKAIPFQEYISKKLLNRFIT